MVSSSDVGKDSEPLDVLEELLSTCTESLANAKVLLGRLRNEKASAPQGSSSNGTYVKPVFQDSASLESPVETLKPGQVSGRSNDAAVDGAWVQSESEGIGQDACSDGNACKEELPDSPKSFSAVQAVQAMESSAALAVVPALPGAADDAWEVDHYKKAVSGTDPPHLAPEVSSFQILEVWAKRDQTSSWQRSSLQLGLASRRVQVASFFSVESDSDKALLQVLKEGGGDEVAESRHPTLSKYILRPDGTFRLVWDMLGLCFVGYDVLALPVQLLDPPNNPFSVLMTWLTRLFWTSDFGITFVSGYIEKSGQIQLQPAKIARHYITTWFVMDLAIVLLDWLDLLLDDSGVDLGSARIGKATRFVRVVRLLRLARVFRVMDAAMVLAERFQLVPERLKLLGEIMKTMSLVLMMAHFIACSWWAVGDASREDPLGYWFQGRPELEGDFYLRYGVSLHWSLAQFQGGMDEFVPHNLAERFFTVCIAILAFCVSAAVLSRLTSLSTQLYILSQQETEQFAMLRSFLKQSHISRALSARINRSVRFKLKTRKTIVQVNQVELLEWVSKGLRVEMDFEIFSRILCHHRFFDRYTQEYYGAMQKVCNEACTVTWVSVGDMVFTQGEIPSMPKLYILQDGILSYMHLSGTVSLIDNRDGKDFDNPRNYICEAVLWVTWAHCGALKAEAYSMVNEVDARRFQEIGSGFEVADLDIRRYANTFVKLLNTRTVISDLALSMTKEEEQKLDDALVNESRAARSSAGSS